MKPIPIEQYLSQFGRAGAGGVVSVREQERREPLLARPRIAAAAIGQDVDQRIADAFERGLNQGLEAARAEAAAARARAMAERDEAERSEQLAFQERQYHRIADEIAAGLEEIETRVADAAARILAPWLADRRVAEAMAAFHDGVTRLLAQGSPAVLKISGPEHLLNIVRDRLAARAVAVEYTTVSAVEVKATLGHTTIETQLQPFADALQPFREQD
jgi:hypothetical protein